MDGDSFYTSQVYDIAHIVDRVGSGDAFAAGLIYGAWVDQASLGLIVLYLGAFLALLASAVYLIGGGARRHHRDPEARRAPGSQV